MLPTPAADMSECTSSEPEVRQVPLVSRFTIAILSGYLLCMGIGSALPPELGEMTAYAGIMGLVAWIICSSYSRERWQNHTAVKQSQVEARLSHFT